jgi:hypothetical protein
MRAKPSALPPHITVSVPFTAPRLPPDTGASTKSNPRPAAAAASSRAMSAEAVVWSTKTVPRRMPSKAPSAPRVTARRSASLPTQANTMSASAAASRGVCAARPPNSRTQSAALAAVRL